MSEFLKDGIVGTCIIPLGKGATEFISVLIPHKPISKEQKYELIELITTSYYNTANPTDVFACEYFYIIDLILTKGYIPLELEYLAIDEIYEEIMNIIKIN